MKVPPDIGLLLRLAGPRAVSEAPERRVPWSAVASSAVDLGLAPLLDHGIRRSSFAHLVPDGVRARLAEIRRLTAVRNAVLLHALRGIETAAAERELPLIVLKGGDYVRTLYPDRSLRVSIDLDVLLARNDALELERHLPGLGYTTSVTMDGGWFEEHLHHGLAWHSAAAGVTLEVHWDLARASDPFSFPVPELLSASEPLGDHGARRLSPTDGIEYLAAHLFRHLTTPDGAARSLVDAMWLLDHADAARIDWDALSDRAARRGTAVPLGLMFETLHAVDPGSGADRRAVRFAAPEDRGAVADARRLMEAMFTLPVRQPPAIVAGLTGLGQARGLSGKLRFLAAGLFPKRRDLNRDLSGETARLPLPLRYGALLAGYAGELAKIGPTAAWTAYRLGRLRGKLTERRRASSSPARP